MPYEIQNTPQGLLLELQGGVTVRHAGELGKRLAQALTSEATVVVRTRELEDIDTSALQMLVSLRKTAANFVLEEPSEAFIRAVDRCALRRDVLAGLKESL